MIFIVLVSGCQIDNYKINIEKINDKNETSSDITAVKIIDLNTNPAKYDGKKIQIRGKASESGWVQRVLLQDYDGLYVMVKDTIKERNYDSGSQYTAVGIFHNEGDLDKPFYLEATEPVRK